MASYVPTLENRFTLVFFYYSVVYLSQKELSYNYRVLVMALNFQL